MSEVQTQNDKTLVCPCGETRFFVSKHDVKIDDNMSWVDVYNYECASCGNNEPVWKSQEEIENE